MSFTQSIKSRWKSWTPVLLIMLIVVFIKLRITSDDNFYLLDGDGPYYALQVRNLAENLQLGMPDVPLTFIIECFFAKLFQIFTSYSSDDCILIGIRFADVFIPPLAAIPVFLISQELKVGETKNNIYSYLIVGFAILNFSSAYAFTYLHKNALAMVWVFYYFLFIIRFIKYAKRKHLYIAIFILALCALTHFGSFSILLLFSLVAGFFWFLQNKASLVLSDYRKVLALLIGPILFLCSLAFFDLTRFKRLLDVPLKIFEAPLLLCAIDNLKAVTFTPIFNLVVMNLLFLIVLITSIYKRRNMTPFQKTLSGTLLLFTFLIANPFLGVEWADRLLLMAFVPITVLSLIFFNSAPKKWLKVLFTAVMLGVMCTSIVAVLNAPGYNFMTQEAFFEFKAINAKINFSKNSVIVGKRDVRLLASWFFRIKSADDYALSKEDLKHYDNVYVIRQINGFNYPPMYLTNRVPFNSVSIYKGENFEVYKLLDAYQWVAENKGSVPKIRGVIDSINLNKITVLNTSNGAKLVVEFSNNTIIHLNKGDTLLKKGMYVEVWGKGRPFSLTVDAEEIIGNKYFTTNTKN